MNLLHFPLCVFKTCRCQRDRNNKGVKPPPNECDNCTLTAQQDNDDVIRDGGISCGAYEQIHRNGNAGCDSTQTEAEPHTGQAHESENAYMKLDSTGLHGCVEENAGYTALKTRKNKFKSINSTGETYGHGVIWHVELHGNRDHKNVHNNSGYLAPVCCTKPVSHITETNKFHETFKKTDDGMRT